MPNYITNKINPKKQYLQIALNSALGTCVNIINQLPPSDKILIEAGTSFIKKYGTHGISILKYWWSLRSGNNGHVIADLKCMDRGSREVQAVAMAGASAATCLGLAPIETINEFIKSCDGAGIDSMVDMMNVEFPFEVLQKLKKRPSIVVLHRGVDENEQNREKQLPHHLINRIKGTYPILISIAGGENIRDVRRNFFNNCDISVVWRHFNEKPNEAAQLAEEFLNAVK